MKKLFITMAVALFMMGANSMNAENVNVNDKNVTIDYNINLSMKAIDKAMILTMEQVDYLETTVYDFNRRVRKLRKVKPEERAQEFNSLLTRNLIDVHQVVLDDAQYRAYLRVLNTEINRTGLNYLLATMDMADVEF